MCSIINHPTHPMMIVVDIIVSDGNGKAKIFTLGIIVYISKDLFFRVGANWFEELQDRKFFEEQTETLRKNFWKSFLLILFVIGAVVTVFSTLLLFFIIVSSRINDELNVSLRQSGYLVHLVLTGNTMS